MNLENLAKVDRLKKIREDAIAIRHAANDGRNRVSCSVTHEAGEPDYDVVLRVAGEAYMRQAVIEACTNSIVTCEAQLMKLGVSIPKPEPIINGSAEQWKRECGMFQRAWSRELGPRRRKSHLIDELVCGTRDLHEQIKTLKSEPRV